LKKEKTGDEEMRQLSSRELDCRNAWWVNSCHKKKKVVGWGGVAK